MPAFEITEHCNIRMQERNIPENIGALILKRVGKALKKRIRASCIKSGCDTQKYIYWQAQLNGKILVIVSQFIDIGKYKAITAFYYNK